MEEWIGRLDQDELIALISADAMEALETRDVDVAAKKEAKQLMRKGLIDAQYVRVAKKVAPKKRTSSHIKAAKKAVPTPPGKKKPVYKTLWANLKHEFYTFICTNDKKYAQLRTNIKSHKKNATLVIVSAIAAAIAATLNVAVAVCVPFISILLMAATAIGVNAWCSTMSAGTP